MKKKNIEKVFQEKLQDYSQLPEEHVWQNIATSLDKKKKKRRVLPLWWKIGGVAALLIVALILFLPKEELPSSDEIITDADQNKPTEELINEVPLTDDLETTDTEGNTQSGRTLVITEDGLSKGSTDQMSAPEEKFTKAAQTPSGIVNREAVATVQEGKINVLNEKDVDKYGQKVIPQEKEKGTDSPGVALAKNDPVEEDSDKVLRESPAENAEATSINMDKSQEKEEILTTEEKADEKISILEAIAQQEEEALKEKSSRKWEVGPRVAPVFFSSLSQGSPIHSSFQDNAKSGNINMSYGLAVTYELSKKIKIRSGLHKVDFGYDTQDVSFSSSLNANTNGIIDNIDYSLSSRNLVVRSNTRTGKLASEAAQDVSGPDPALNGKMVQEFGYLEVPLELTYEILNRKFGVNLIGGVSSLFLVNNNVMLEAEGITTEMGEANNINDLNLSTNFGVGVSYRFNDKLQLNLEPMFKYQLNTFSETSGNFQPFSMGVYSGLNFRF